MPSISIINARISIIHPLKHRVNSVEVEIVIILNLKRTFYSVHGRTFGDSWKSGPP
jgi:hypothetical protein